MTTQLYIHGNELRTFADAKGAKKAIKRDLAKHTDAHGDVLYATGIDAQQNSEGRWGVIVHCDVTHDELLSGLVGDELTGYALKAERVAEPAKKSKPAKPAKPSPTKKRRSGEVKVEPQTPLFPARAGSKQQAIIDMLAKGATMADLRTVCVKRDGTTWDDSSITSALYYDVHQKGYGVRTEWKGDVAKYFLVLPEGFDEPLKPRTPKS